MTVLRRTVSAGHCSRNAVAARAPVRPRQPPAATNPNQLADAVAQTGNGSGSAGEAIFAATRRPSPHAGQLSQLEQIAAPADSHSTTSITAHAAGTQRIPRARHASAPLSEPITPTSNGSAHTSAAEVPVVPRHVPAAGQPGQLGRVVTLADSRNTSADTARASCTQRQSTGHEGTAQHRQLAILTPQSVGSPSIRAAIAAVPRRHVPAADEVSQLGEGAAPVVVRAAGAARDGISEGTARAIVTPRDPAAAEGAGQVHMAAVTSRWEPEDLCYQLPFSTTSKYETYTDLKLQHDIPFTVARMGRQFTCQDGQPLTERAWQGRGPWPISQGRPGSSGAPRGSRPRSARSRNDRRSTSAERRR